MCSKAQCDVVCRDVQDQSKVEVEGSGVRRLRSGNKEQKKVNEGQTDLLAGICKKMEWIGGSSDGGSCEGEMVSVNGLLRRMSLLSTTHSLVLVVKDCFFARTAIRSRLLSSRDGFFWDFTRFFGLDVRIARG